MINVSRIQKYNLDDFHMGELLTKFSGLAYATLLFVLLILPIVAVPISAYAANVDIGITSITANPANSVTVPSGCGSWCTAVTIAVTFHNYGSSPVSNVGYAYDYRGFSEGLPQSSILSCPSTAGLTIPAFGDYVHQFTWYVAEDEAGTFGTSAYQFNAYVSAYCDTETNLSNNQYSIPYHVYLSTSTGTLSVDTSPVKGEVYVDTSDWGVAPQSRSNVATGQRTVSFGSVTGYTTPSPQTVQVNAGQTTSVLGAYIPPWKSNLIDKITTIKRNLQGVLDNNVGSMANSLITYEQLSSWDAWSWDTAQAVTDGVGYAVAVYDVTDAWGALKQGITASGWKSALPGKTADTVLQEVGSQGADEVIFVTGYVYEQQVKNGIAVSQRDIDRQTFMKAASYLLDSDVKSGADSVTIQAKLKTNPDFRYTAASSQLSSTLSDLQNYITNYPSSSPPSGLDLAYLNSVLDQINGQVQDVRQNNRPSIVFPYVEKIHHTVDFPDMYRMNLAIGADISQWRAGQAGSMVMSWGGIAYDLGLPVLVAVGIVTAPAGIGVVILGSVAFSAGALLFQMHSTNGKGNAMAALESQYGFLLGTTYSVVVAMQQVSNVVQDALSGSNLPTQVPSGGIQSVVRAGGLFSQTVTVTVTNTGSVTNGFLIASLQSQDGSKPVQVVPLEYAIPAGQTVSRDLKFKLDWLCTIFGSTYTITVEYYLGPLKVGTYGPSQIKLGGPYFGGSQFLSYSGGWSQIPGATLSPPSVAFGESEYLVVRGTDNGIYFYDCGSSSWRRLSGGTADAPASIVLDGKLHIVVRGTDNGIYYSNIDLSSNSWSGWSRLGGATLSAAALAATPGLLYVVVRGTNNGVYYDRLDVSKGVWSGWVNLNGATGDVPAVTVLGSSLYVVVRGTNSGIYYTTVDLGTGAVAAWSRLSGATSSSPALSASGPDRLDLVVRGTNSGIYHQVWTVAGGWSNAWETLSGATGDAPTTAVSLGKLVTLVRGTDSGVYVSTLNLSSGIWSGWVSIAGATSASPTVGVGGTTVQVIVRGTNNGIYTYDL